MEILQEDKDQTNLAVWVDTKAKRIGIIIGDGDEELVIDLSPDQAKKLNFGISEAIDQIEGRKAVML